MENKINPEMITLARELKGMTQGRLASELKVSQGRVSKLESGLLDNVPEDLLNRLSATLNFPIDFFFLKDELHGLGVTILFHRKRKSLPIKTLKEIQAEVNLIRIHVSRLLKSVELTDNKFFQADTEDYNGDIKEIVRVVKNTWILPTGPAKNISNAIENAGGIIISCDFKTRLLDALSLWKSPELPPLFFINKNAPSDRIRFSLAHELGHIFMHRIGSPEIEDEANRFAAEFLMPEDEISFDLRCLNLVKLAQLKQYWKVSMAALIKRASDLNLITDRQSRYLWMQMSVNGYKTKEPAELDIPFEEPVTFKNIFNLHKNELGYSQDDLCRLLKTFPRIINKIYGLEKNKPLLYAVK